MGEERGDGNGIGRPIVLGAQELCTACLGYNHRRHFCRHLALAVPVLAVQSSVSLQEPRGAEVPRWCHSHGAMLCSRVGKYISLVDPSISVEIEILRDGYEAFAMYCFGRYLVACLGGEDRTIEFLKKEGGSGSDAPLLGHASEQRYVNHPFPMNYMLKPWPLGEFFYLIIKFGLVQYVCGSLSPTPFDFAACDGNSNHSYQKRDSPES